jgi:hypothetical protein
MIHNKAAVVIATRFYPPQLQRLAEDADDSGMPAIIVPDVFGRGPDWSLYALWNAGLRVARETFGAQYVAFVNDDAELLPGSFATMRYALIAKRGEYGIVYPNTERNYSLRIGSSTDITPTEGTWGENGMTGFCFMVDTKLVPFGFDESYRWWYGDDDFEARVRHLGLLVGRIEALPIRHSPNGSASRAMAALGPMIDADRALWTARHADAVPGPATAVTEAVS